MFKPFTTVILILFKLPPLICNVKMHYIGLCILVSILGSDPNTKLFVTIQLHVSPSGKR